MGGVVQAQGSKGAEGQGRFSLAPLLLCFPALSNEAFAF